MRSSRPLCGEHARSSRIRRISAKSLIYSWINTNPREGPLYEKILQATAVYSLFPVEMTGKFKMAQNKNEADRRKIIAKLKERGSPADRQIVEEIQKTLMKK